MIDETKAKELVKKYCPNVTLVINDGADGLYLYNSNEILIGKNWHIAGLLHEITHAILNADEPRTCHDGVFADKYTQIVHEVFEEENEQLKKWCEEFNALEVVKENEKLEKQLSIAKKAINGAARRIRQLASSTALNYLERAKKKIKKIDEELK